MKIYAKKYLYSPSLLALGIFICVSVFLVLFSGPIGYSGDAWNFIYTSLYTTDITNPAHLHDHWLLHRPIQYVLQIYLLLKLPGVELNTFATHLSTLLFLSLSVFLFGKILERCYPNQPSFIFITLLLLFFYEPLFASTFILHHSTFFFTAITFWGAGLCLLNMLHVKSPIWSPLLFLTATGCFILSVFAVENFILVIWAIPLIIYLGTEWSPSMTTRAKCTHVFLKALLPAGVMFGIVLGLKFYVVQYIGRSTNLSLPHFAEWLWKYWIFALAYEFDAVKGALFSNLWYLTLIFFGGFLFLNQRWKPKGEHGSSTNQYTPLLLGFLLYLFGIAPMIIGGYEIDIFHRTDPTGRYVASSFGVILLLSGLLLLRKNKTFRTFIQLLLLFLLSCNITFAFNLTNFRKEATRIQKSLYTSLLELCPDVEDDTVFVFFDSYVRFNERTKVFGPGGSGTNALIRTIYNNPTISGTALYSKKEAQHHDKVKTVITDDYIKPRGPQGKSYPIDRVILLKWSGQRFEFTELKKSDSLHAIWATACYEVDDDALRREGLPEGIVQKLRPLKNRLLFKEDLHLALEKHLDARELQEFHSKILDAVLDKWTEHYYQVTTADIEVLQNEHLIPSAVLPNLSSLANRRFISEENFWNALEPETRNILQPYREQVLELTRKESSHTVIRSNMARIKPTLVESKFMQYLKTL